MRQEIQLIDFGEKVLTRVRCQDEGGEDWKVTHTATSDNWHEAVSKLVFGEVRSEV